MIQTLMMLLTVATISNNTAIATTSCNTAVSVNTYMGYTEEEIDLMASIVYLEAGNQDMLGKQLVADVILNRVDSLDFPNTVHEVIYQKGQFSTAKKAKSRISYTPIDCYGAVISQITVRENYDVIYFGRGFGCGEKLFKYGDHCFSGKKMKKVYIDV